MSRRHGCCCGGNNCCRNNCCGNNCCGNGFNYGPMGCGAGFNNCGCGGGFGGYYNNPLFLLLLLGSFRC
ncbi:hypothetical protein [Clostridium fungisolvens]|uniref:hypothetical protein n=1 Tax=Clostridium fungisolvens TaxID=1604897 RepID=UPI00160A60BB|nr:hypothetical protein [Clostridium fungisolvens]